MSNERDDLEMVYLPDGNTSDVDVDDEDDHISVDEHAASSSVQPELPVPDIPVISDNIEQEDSPEVCYRWRHRKQREVNTTCNYQLSPPPDKEKTPYEYFKEYFPDQLLEIIAFQTNVYAMEKSGISPDISGVEIEKYLAILLYTTIMPAADMRNYWQKDIRWNIIADIMPVKRFEQIKQYLHFCDNSQQIKKGQDGYDPLFKIRAIFDYIRKVCQSVEPTEYQSVDEMMIPFKGRLSFKQYMPKKPTKWGIKVFCRCSTTGIVHDMIVYCGSDTTKYLGNPENSNSSVENIVIELVKSLPKTANFKLYFDNYFTTLKLMLLLQEKFQIHTTGTIRTNRLKNCPLESESNLRSQGRGSTDAVVDLNSNITVVRWLDNSTVTLASTYASIEPTTIVRRWSRKEKKTVSVSCPFIVSEYNRSMGGVDLSDMLISLYAIDRKSKKWYMRVFYHLISISISNSWLLYRRHLQQMYGPNSKFIPLSQFIQSIAHALARAGKTDRRFSNETRPSIASEIRPVSDVRYDSVDHLPIHSGKRMRCKNTNCTGTTRFSCRKCGVSLCLNENTNCFISYHTKA